MSTKETFRQKWEGRAPGASGERAQFEALLYLAAGKALRRARRL